MRVDGVVLAGGAARRMGGTDKPALRVGGRSLLGTAVTALAGAGRVAVVGPSLPEDAAPGGADVVLTREEPPGSGPVTALLAGLELVVAPVVVVLAADLPRADARLVEGLLRCLHEAGPAVDAVVPVDGHGREQWLAAAYRTAPLRAALEAALAARPVGPEGRGPGLRDVVPRVRWTAATDPVLSGRLSDVDTPEQLSRAHLEAWTVALAARWGLEPQLRDLLDDPGVLVADVLDVAKDAAHTVARPAAPLTTFLLGAALAARAALEDSPAAGEDLAALRGELAEALREHGEDAGTPDR
ncbi:NTP transferase domain-containing protein [Aquipuribacter nitratireducens]|uniref:NTP transferase domain-containing protein n=1 Tax=Aquipuribacter nitratireducens TaxID=650104 RepID=A0ABW0GP08_9MICO